jgi:HlyD family secretion protein
MSVPVQVETLKMGSIDEEVELVGTVRSMNRIRVSSEIEGVIREVLLREGDFFESGELLIQLDPRDWEIELQAAQANLNQARENLNELLRGTRPEVVEQYRAAVAKEEANYEDTQRNFNRVKSLFESEVTSESQLDDARYRLDAARAQLAEAKARLEEAVNGATAEEIASARATVAARQADVARAKRNLEKTSIRAPFDGVVAARFVDKGAYVSRGKDLMDLVSTEGLDIFFETPERLISSLQPGNPVEVRSDVFPDFKISVPIEAVMPAANEASRNFRVRCVIRQQTPLKPGMFVRVRAQVARREKTLLAPQDALLTDNGQTRLFVVNGEQAEQVAIQVGLRNETHVEIFGDLKEGQQVITVGNEGVSDGTKIRIQGQGGGPPRGAPAAG